MLNYINALLWGDGNWQGFSNCKKNYLPSHFPRTYVIESTNFQVRGQRKSKPVYGHQGTKNSWDAFTSFTCVSQVGLLFRNKEHGGKI